MIEYKKLLSCWHKLEHFSPASLPKGNNIEVLNKPEPWSIPRAASRPNYTIEYTIYLGVFDSIHVSNFVKEYFGEKENDENERNSKICFASLKLDINGVYINDSIGISTLPWALSKLEKGEIKSDNWSRSFEQLKEVLVSDFDYIFNNSILKDDGTVVNNSKPVYYDKLKEIEVKVEKLCDWSINPEKSIFIKIDEKFKSNTEASNSNSNADILNSFYTKDLENIISNFTQNENPKAFIDYLNGSLNKQKNRTDLSKDINCLRRTLTPLEYPDGCWPSKYSLSLMQQFAVNNIFNNLSEADQSGLLSVNGPPGTGKTTLLRDIIAPILVKRAKTLSTVKNPADSFVKVGNVQIKEGSMPTFIYAPDYRIINAGIVVASSNNGAVENISKELPLKKEVSSYSKEISYFRNVAENCINKDNWGLISAVLGNKQNRNELIKSIWFNKEFTDLQKTLATSKVYDNSDWDKIVLDFNAKLKEVSQEKIKLEKYRKEYDDFIKLELLKKELDARVIESQSKQTEIRNRLKEQQGIVRKLDDTKKETITELTLIKQSKPNFFVYWFNKKIRIEYNISFQAILSKYNNISKDILNANFNLQEEQSKFNEISELLKSDLSKQSSTKVSYDNLTHITSQARTELKQNYADNEFWKNIESKSSQEACPWYSENLKKLQSELFIISLKLNESFIINANSKSSRITTTLIGFFEYLKGNMNVSKIEVKAMWDTFFMVIPVISSTFASIQTMFKDLDKEDIPWLFIDEAGQAIPQAAAGAIWRSKRVVVVGDPFQIEPVVTIPNTITNNISKYFELNDSQINAELSVQSMADRINSFGAFLKINEKETWIGIPLRVHRRCLSPMFEISNKIAYENSMYSATLIPKSIGISFENSFIHCKGSVIGRHFVEEQALIVRELLIKEIKFSSMLPDVFVITPFSEISYKLNSFLFKPLIAEIGKYDVNINRDIMSEWLKTHIGTVHTFQGKQAEGVILCLGLDEKSQGAAAWASKKPNLLNVAVTRAKYRFIAIGDEKIWLKQQHFNELRNLSSN